MDEKPVNKKQALINKGPNLYPRKQNAKSEEQTQKQIKVPNKSATKKVKYKPGETPWDDGTQRHMSRHKETKQMN